MMTFEQAKLMPSYKFTQAYTTEQILDYGNIPNVDISNVLAVLECNGVDIELVVNEVDRKRVVEYQFLKDTHEGSWEWITHADFVPSAFSEEEMFTLLAAEFPQCFDSLVVEA